MSKRKCSTCAAVETQMTRPVDTRLRYKYYARILERCERDLNLDGEWVHAGDYTWQPSPLNYCPECGKRLEEINK